MTVSGLDILRGWFAICALLCQVFHKPGAGLSILWGVVLLSVWIEDKMREC